jgi:hypothetical protein
MKLWLLLLSLTSLGAQALEMRRLDLDPAALKADLRLIQEKAKWTHYPLSFTIEEGDKNLVQISCKADRIELQVSAPLGEQVSTLYHGIFHLGFLFPHPRIQLSPSIPEAMGKCGQSFEWRPAFKKRGFHLHTLHPSEFTKGFLDGETDIALDLVRWLARNRQNVFDLSLLRMDWEKESASLKKPFALAKALGISRGVALGIIFSQQKSFKLLAMTRLWSHLGNMGPIRRNLEALKRDLDIDFLNLESGSSEFTSVSYEKSLSWLNLITSEAKAAGIKVFTKVHVSSNQVSKKWGNFNFLPQYASNDLGLLPHTVMFYGLYDKKAPMYGNKNFSHMLDFVRAQKGKKEMWYYPETSYWVFMDIDVPLLLTDYLTTRSEDMRRLHEEGIDGHFNFTTGQELGYWLFDWTLTLNTDLDQKFDSQSGLKLLGEDRDTWEKILRFQTTHIKVNELIGTLSFPNLQDELAPGSRVHERNTLKELSASPLKREDEIRRLEAAIAQIPSVEGVRNEELRSLLEVTHLRFKHALEVRKSLRFSPESSERLQRIEEAKAYRLEAQRFMDHLTADYNRYPEARVFERHSTLTSYAFGYLWTAATLKNWEREEMVVRNQNFSPFYMNFVNPLSVVF